MTLKKIHIAFMTAALLLSACTEDMTERTTLSEGGLTFSVAMDNGSSDLSITRAMAQSEQTQGVLLESDYAQPLYMHTLVEPRTVTTRTTLMEGTEFATTDVIGVSGYRYTTTAPLSSALPNFYYNAQLAYTGGEWKTTEAYYIPANTEKLAFYAYYPYDATATDLSSNTAAGPMTISYNVTSESLGLQVDLLTASTTNLTYNASPSYQVPLSFRHALTAIRLQLGDNVVPGYIKKVSFMNVKTSGTHTIGGGWSGTSSTLLELDYTNGNTVDGFETNTGSNDLQTGERTLLMIPQTFAADDDLPCIRVEVFDVNENKTHTFYYHLKGTTWAANTMVTYVINTASINVVRLGTITFPANWDGDAFSVKTDYEANDSVGVFAVDANGYVLAANAKYVYDGTQWKQPAGADVLLYQPNCRYFLYYPYRGTLAGAPAVGYQFTGTDDSDFFSNVINDWTTTTDQSTVAKLSLSDLQTGMSTPSGAVRYDFTMSHRMGLAGVDLSGESSSGTVSYHLSTDENYTWTATQTVTVPASTAVQDKQLCPKADNWYYYVTKAGQQTVFKCQKNNANGDWAQDYSITIGSGEYDTFKPAIEAPTGTLTTVSWDLNVGDVYFSDGALGTSATSYGTSKTPVGIVFYKNTTSTPMAANDINAGYTHAYVVSAKDAGGYRTFYAWGSTNGTSTGNSYVGVTFAALTADMDGRTKTANIKASAGANFASLYPAAYAAVNYKNSYACPATPRSSEWFLPSIGQQYYWMMTMCPPSAGRVNTNIGFQYENCSRPCADAMNSYYNSRGFTGSLYDAIARDGTVQTVIWSSTEYNSSRPYYMYFNVPSKIGFDCYSTSRTPAVIVRPMLAF